MGAQPTQAVAMPNMGAQPVAQQYAAPVAIAPAVVAQPQPVAQQYAAPVAIAPAVVAQPQPVAQQYAAPVAIAPAVVAQPQPVAQPDPARDYYNDLVAKGYPSADAMTYTKQYYPEFQA
jgi:hypothetical protein